MKSTVISSICLALLLSACGSEDNNDIIEFNGLELRVIDDNVPYPEGPLWVQDRLYYVGYASDQVLSWDGDAIHIVWEARRGEAFTRCGPSALVQRHNGNLLVSCYDTNQLVEITLDGAEVAIFEKDDRGQPFVGPNDFTRDGKGGIYFSASGVFDENEPATGKVYYLDTDNNLTNACPRVRFAYSNGLALFDGESKLLVSEHLKNAVTLLEVKAPGELINPKQFIRLNEIAENPPKADPKIGPDGLKVGPTTGNIYICQWSASRILVTNPEGKLLSEIALPYPYVTNVNFKGNDENTLFVSVETDANNPDWVYSGKLYQVNLDQGR